MGYNQGYAAYQNASVKTASQGKLIILLYEAAVRNLMNANSLINNENKIRACDIEKYSTLIQKTQAIICELQVSLDMEKGGDIAKNLMSLYVFFNTQLNEVNIDHNKNKISSLINMLSELLDGWKQAASSVSSSMANVPATSALNILG